MRNKCHATVKVGTGAGPWKRRLGPRLDDVVVKQQGKGHLVPQILAQPPTRPLRLKSFFDSKSVMVKPLSPATSVALTPTTKGNPVVVTETNYSAAREAPRAHQRAPFIPRREFRFDRDLSFYLGFMNRRSPQMRHILQNATDLVIEVRDSRAPLTSGNFFLTDNLPAKLPRIVVLNKADTVDLVHLKKAKDLVEAAGLPCLATHGTDFVGARHIREFIFQNVRTKWKSLGLWAMVVGLPNVGKSSLVNAFRGEAVATSECLEGAGRLTFTRSIYPEKQTKVTAIPTTTKRVLPMKISEDPKFYVYDTPGIGIPRLHDREIGLKLACINCIPPHVAGYRYLCDYLLYRLNNDGIFDYVDEFLLDGPTDDIIELRDHIFRLMKAASLSSALSGEIGYQTFLSRFHRGALGCLCLDQLHSIDQLDYRANANCIREPPGPWGPAQATFPVMGLS